MRRDFDDAKVEHGRNAWRDRGKPRFYRTDRICKEKQRYQDEVSVRAGGAVSLGERKNRDQLWCYACRHCRGWHLTSQKQGPRWQITAEDPVPQGVTR